MTPRVKSPIKNGQKYDKFIGQPDQMKVHVNGDDGTSVTTLPFYLTFKYAAGQISFKDTYQIY